MTVRLSALFETLWARAPASPARPRRARPRRARPRRNAETSEAMNGSLDHDDHLQQRASDDSSSEETLAATSRRVHRARHAPAPASSAPALQPAQPRGRARDSWDSDAPLHTHTKGKGIGKKSKSSSNNSTEPVPSTSGVQHVYNETNGGRSWSDGSALLEAASDSDACEDIEVLEEELEDDVELAYEEPRPRKRRRRPASGSGSGSSEPGRWGARPVHAKRTRERFTSASSSSSSADEEPAERRYESDHSYHPRHSTDEDAPLHLYRQRQEGATENGSDAGPSSGRRQNGHARGVSLRARRSPRRYNEDSDDDTPAAISKRSQHQHQQRQLALHHRRTRHALQVPCVIRR
ncbi:nucleolar and coiled-body phosphoprotein 1-like isoform X2 [Ostrinia furnacalis]|uniref:nucleolar and coiled-body phosphoprotein 1-like isoform X2 n=1 Tax=Ostrinia furnacalis TaxID=93504 RepID=UPI00103A6C2C|nr:nucleolar and coiled-body phosphoprotein 1-like isoform X2 [Ostrinia furnacalis]